MITRNALRAIALATSCLAPMAAFAQAPTSSNPQTPAISISGTPISGDVDLGFGGVFGRNADQAGRYNGLNTTGVDFFGGFHLSGRDAWDSGGTRYYEFSGERLNIQTGNKLGSGVGSSNGWANSTTNSIGNEASIDLRVGDQGTWGIGAYYHAITYTGNVIDSLYTVNGSQAYLNPTLRAYGGATSQTAPTPGAVTNYTIPQLQATGAMLPVQTGTRRDILGGNFEYQLGNWTFSGAFKHEHKEGSLEETYYGWKGGMAFALPVDYDTDRYDATAAYHTRLYQGIVQYTFSHFTDNNLFVSLPWPVANSAPYQTASAYSLPPNNTAQYVTLMLATNVVPKTRINLNARVGVEKQDDSFAPNTASPNLTAGQLTAFGLNSNVLGTTANSPDITATVYQVKISANSNPIPRTDINAYYGVDGRNVNLNQYAVTTGGHAPDTIGSTTVSYVVPQDWFKQYLGGEVGYSILPQYNTRISVGYRLDITDRSNAQVGHSSTNTASLAVASNFGPQVNGRISFDYSSRTGTLSYLTPWANLDGAGSSPTWSGAYYQAPMTSEAVTVRADYEPNNQLATDLFLQFRNENYTYPSTAGYGSTPQPLTGVGGGVKQDYVLSVGPDVAYHPTKWLNFHAFYNYELMFFNNLGNGQCATSNTGACLGSAGYFQNKDTTSTHTVGISGEWTVNDKLKIKADYNISYGTVMFAEFNGVFVANPTASYQNVTNYPDINSLMNTVTITATYQLTPTIELLAEGAYTSLHTTNWYDNASAIQGSGSTTISLLTPGYGSPTYSIGMLMGGMRVRF